MRVSKDQFLFKGKYDTKIEFPARIGGGGFQAKRPSVGGVHRHFLEQHIMIIQ